MQRFIAFVAKQARVSRFAFILHQKEAARYELRRYRVLRESQKNNLYFHKIFKGHPSRVSLKSFKPECPVHALHPSFLLESFEQAKYNVPYRRTEQYGLHDIERSWQKVGNFRADDQLLLFRRPYPRRREDGNGMADSESRGKAD